MGGRWGLPLVVRGLKNLSPRTKRMSVFWVSVVAVAEVGLILSGKGGIWQAVMLAATVALILVVEIGQDIARFIKNRPEPPEESLPAAVARTAVDSGTMGYDLHTPPDVPAVNLGTVDAMTGDAVDEVAAGAAEGAAETVDVVGEVVKEAVGEIISGS